MVMNGVQEGCNGSTSLIGELDEVNYPSLPHSVVPAQSEHLLPPTSTDVNNFIRVAHDPYTKPPPMTSTTTESHANGGGVVLRKALPQTPTTSFPPNHHHHPHHNHNHHGTVIAVISEGGIHQPLLAEKRTVPFPSTAVDGHGGHGHGDCEGNDGACSSCSGFMSYLKRVLFVMLLGCRLNVLLLFLPAALLASAHGYGKGWVFAFSLFSLAPLAERLGFVTEQIALSTNPMVGGLLNASFGNAPELILCIVALKGGRVRIVQLSLLGSFVGNMLLCLGSAFFAGGLYHKEQQFNSHACMTNSGLSMLAAMGTVFPTLLHSTHTESEVGVDVLQLSRIYSAVMLIAYASYIVFQLVTHAGFYHHNNNNNNRNDNNNNNNNSNNNNNNDEEEEEEEEEAIIGVWGSLPWLTIITICISVASDLLVDTVAAAAKSWGVPVAFLCMIVLPIFNNVAEHASAIMFGLKDKLDLSIGIAAGSSVQISMFLLPLCVMAGWVFDKPLDLNFHMFETATFCITIVFSTILMNDGKSNWLKGLVLVLSYVIIASAFFFHKDRSLVIDVPKNFMAFVRTGVVV